MLYYPIGQSTSLYEAIMARVTKDLTNQNEICGPIVIPDEEAHYATVAIDGAADGSVVLEAMLQASGANPPVEQWIVQGMVPAAGGAAVQLLTGNGTPQMATGGPTAAWKVRVRKSVAGSGAMRVTLSTGCL